MSLVIPIPIQYLPILKPNISFNDTLKIQQIRGFRQGWVRFQR